MQRLCQDWEIENLTFSFASYVSNERVLLLKTRVVPAELFKMNNSAGKLNTEISIQLYSRSQLKCLSSSLSTVVLNELWKFFMNYSVNMCGIKNRATLFPVCSSIDNRSLVTRKFFLYKCAYFQSKHKFICLVETEKVLYMLFVWPNSISKYHWLQVIIT